LEQSLQQLTINVARAAKYIALLALFLAAVSAAAGAVAARRYGNGALAASAVAAAIVWLAGSAALGIVASAKTPPQRLNAVLLAMLVRLALPMVAVVALSRSQNQLADNGVAGLIVVHYLAGLLLETWLSLRLASVASTAGTSSAPKQVVAH
jgi:hypothetical protein